ncbi:MAG: glucosamine-6-phosphate deaminase [Planctomycetota bacterium]|nr:glucosamine-6-phosphate deaminase [Planctomycetota bacterium]
MQTPGFAAAPRAQGNPAPARLRRPRAGIERMPFTIFPDSGAAARSVAREIAQLVRERASRGELAVLGLATGSTPIGVYDELVRLHRQEGLSFANVATFNLDEYWPMAPDSIHSYRRFMFEHLFDHIDINPGNVHIPDGTVDRDKMPAFCEEYERKILDAGGVDLQILGIGRTGHIGFNEPGSPKDSRTRLITLDRVTRMDAASDFFGERNVPRKALTMGVGTILAAKRVILMAFGEHKAGIIRQTVEGPVTPAVAASFLQEHAGAELVLDTASAAELTRVKTPWLLSTLHEAGLGWDAAQTKRAAVWLALKVAKPILKLTDEDYNEHGLQELLSARGSAYDINIEVFRSLQATITGWPGGKPEDPELPVRVSTHNPPGPVPPGPFPKRVVVFSPHPDDDVISMGGTLIRLCDQGHDVHVAYQTSGNIAVWDDTAIRHADFVTEFCRAFSKAGGGSGAGLDAQAAQRLEDSIQRFVMTKTPGQVDSPELQKIKGLIRRTEARAAAKYSGVPEDRVHFLDLPFYETGKVRKKPIREADVAIVMGLLDSVQPHQIYAAGDLSDPHGTHRVCLAAIVHAVERLASRPWMKDCVLWLYRGAWQEWEPHDIEMAVPLAPDEVDRKRRAIFKHESQKDKALFPGPNDPREFWQRAEDRNRNTARLYDKLGLAEYEAIEGFVRYRARSGESTIEVSR